MTFRQTAGALLAILFLAGAPAAAQNAPNREGFFIGFGFGGGGGSVNDAEDVEGGTGWLTIGGTLSPKLRLAGDINGFVPSDNEDFSMGTTTFTALYYPTATTNFFLKGGLGAASVSYTGPGSDASGVGFGGVVGAGYDIRVGRKVSITPQFTFFGGRTGDLEDDDGNPVFNDVGFGLAALSIGIVFH